MQKNIYNPYQIIEHIDQGAFGNVQKVYNPESKTYFAMKIIKLPINISKLEKDKALNEGEILRNNPHPNTKLCLKRRGFESAMPW